jgi:hypothetical protein
MNKRIIFPVLVPSMLEIGLMQSGCFGSFALTKKVYTAVDNIGPKDQTGGVIRTLIMMGSSWFQQ